ncbi:uncharacterized protein [Elaeis guineensis]|uniref:uncharacterized protein n=1 Tax=Elaeis guineensis var. tenera TaxID=51953 RepID=UPI003C6D9423
MGKRSRVWRSSSIGAGSPLDKIFCRDPADAWEVKSAPAPPPPPPPDNPAVTDRPSPPPSTPPHGETDLEVVEALPPTPKKRIASPRAPIFSEARKKAPEGRPTSPVIFSVEASCQEPSTEDFVPKKPEKLFESCFFCKNVLRANKPIYMFGYMRAFCSPFCRAKQMKLEGVVLTTNTKASEVSPTYVDKKSGSTRSQLSS